MIETMTFYLEGLKSLLERLPLSDIEEAIYVLNDARFRGNKVIIMGNGGSATTASHFACDLGKGTLSPGFPRFRVLALTDNISLFSALANDCGYDQVFGEQVKSLVRPGDVVIGISASGNSPNVLNGVEVARQEGATTIGFVGFDGGELKDRVDLAVHVPSDFIEQVEDVHLILEHLICFCLRQILEEEMFQVPEAVSAANMLQLLGTAPG
jgi:D-sedoheptulose 7-phosphate isomerase